MALNTDLDTVIQNLICDKQKKYVFLNLTFQV